jgi:hypothetical protein
MAGSGYLPNTKVERFLAFTHPEAREIVMELRNLVSAVCPDAAERILWRGLSYHDQAKGGPVKGAVCQIELAGNQVRIAFIHGARLRDPEAMLVGDRMSKRYVPIASYEQAPWEGIRALIEEAAALDPSKFGPLPPGGKKSAP